MKVFISWSGDKSRLVALALREWLPAVINTFEPFVSSKDIYAGSRWQAEIAKELGSTNFGIVCVTKANQGAPWLNFEAGALAKAVELSQVVPLAIDLKPSDITLPLGQFQAQAASKEGIEEILIAMNDACAPPLGEALLARAIAKWWPDLEAELAAINQRAPEQGEQHVRTDRALLEETLDTVRVLSRRLESRDAGSSLVAPPDAAVFAELHALLASLDPSAKILVSKGGLPRVTILCRTRELATGLQEPVRELLEPHGVTARFITQDVRAAKET